MKQTLKLTILIMSIAIIGLTCKKPDPETTGSVQGTVKTTNGQSIEGALVKINTSPNETTVTTKSDGSFAFNSLTPKTYQISVKKDGYADMSQNVDVVAGEPKTLDFVLNVYNPTFTITSPKAGLNWSINTTQNITWTSTGLTGNVKIELLKNAAIIKTIETSTENTGTYPWLISNDIVAGTDYKIKITSLSVPTIFDESDFFTISTVQSTLTVTPTTKSVVASGETFSITVNSNITWNVTADSWITLSQNSGTNGATISATCGANSTISQRTGAITFTGTGVTNQVITVTQSGQGITLTVNPTSLNFVTAGETKSFAITSNTTWTVSSNETWCTVSPASNSNNGTVNVTCTANAGTTNRTATITVSGTGATTQTVSITQNGVSLNLSVTPTTLDFIAAGETKPVSVTSNTSWIVTSNQSWCTLSAASGNNNSSINVICSANSTISQRTATVTFSATGVTNQMVTVTQAANTSNTVTDIDGNVYNIVVIGTQTWMKENLKVTKYKNGDAIQNVTNNSTWSSLTTGAYGDYDNTPSNSTTYGRLYNWYVVNDSRGVCPTGWHVPTDLEWNTLTTYLGGESVAGGKMKSTTGWYNNGNGTNTSGFTGTV